MVSAEHNLQARIVDELPRLRRFAYSLTSNKEDADDLAQQVIERVLQKGVPEDVNLRRWCYRLCRNAWIDEIRSREVRRREDIIEHISQDESIDGEADLVGGLDAKKIVDAVAELPEGQRLSISLISVEGMSYAQAADEMGVPVGTVMSRLSRARQYLLQRLAPFMAGE